jgi:hypothetical protein
MRNLKTSQMLAIIFALLAAVGFAVVMVQLQPEEVEVVVPTRNIAAFEPIDTKTDFEVIKVRKGNVKELDVNVATVEWLNDYVKKEEGGILFSTISLFPEMASIDNRYLRNKVDGTLALVNSVDERPVSVSLDPVGSGSGSVKAGDVVTVVPSSVVDGGNVAIPNVKVIAIGPAGNIAAGLQGNTTAEGGGALAALLAVPADAADSLVGTQVNLVLNPFCVIDEDGNIIASEREGADKADCGAPAAEDGEEEAAPAEEGEE